MDRARLDYALVLISTTLLEVINVSSTMLIDGRKYMLKLVEEWGCNLGEDAFLSKDATESEARTEALSQNNDDPGFEKVNGDMDVLVDDLSNEWMENINVEVGSKSH
jgi:hypothetical protein